MAPDSSTLAWKTPWMEEADGLQSIGSLRVGHDWSNLAAAAAVKAVENPMDRRAWWAVVHGITQSWTQLKRLSVHAYIGEGNSNPFQYSYLENPTDRGAWRATVHGPAKSQTQVSNWANAIACFRCWENKNKQFVSLIEPIFPWEYKQYATSNYCC